ncbi:MAG: hypothetical protein JWM34_2748 [Ilumatobacteraceae bacterium]|nr:hypothetical protein [Ilumatobacteraceae bacterium]
MRTCIAALDHLVLATPDLHATAAWFADMTGVTPSAGGQHVGKGTRNMLCSFGHTSYLEIVGPDPEQPAPAGPRPFGIDDLTDAAMVAWAIAVPDMDAALAHAREAGYDPGPAAPMQRVRPDGVTLGWTLTTNLSVTTPFLIEWKTQQHPAASAALGLEISELRARHPHPDLLESQLDALGVTMGVMRGSEALLIELRGPLGSAWFPSATDVRL